MRSSVLAVSIASSLMACAPYKVDPLAETAYSDNRTSTGSNIPKKGDAVIVDKSVIEDQIHRQGGWPMGGSVRP